MDAFRSAERHYSRQKLDTFLWTFLSQKQKWLLDFCWFAFLFPNTAKGPLIKYTIKYTIQFRIVPYRSCIAPQAILSCQIVLYPIVSVYLMLTESNKMSHSLPHTQHSADAFCPLPSDWRECSSSDGLVWKKRKEISRHSHWLRTKGRAWQKAEVYCLALCFALLCFALLCFHFVFGLVLFRFLTYLCMM